MVHYEKQLTPILISRAAVTWPRLTSIHPLPVISSRYGRVPIIAGRPPSPLLLRLFLHLSLGRNERDNFTLTTTTWYCCHLTYDGGLAPAEMTTGYTHVWLCQITTDSHLHLLFSTIHNLFQNTYPSEEIRRDLESGLSSFRGERGSLPCIKWWVP